MYYNNIQIVGNLTRDPETRSHPDDASRSHVSFNIAVNPNKDKDPFFLNCKVWNEKKKEFVLQYLKKGDRVFVTGPFNAYKFTRKDGDADTGLEVLINDVQVLYTRKKEDGDEAPRKSKPDALFKKDPKDRKEDAEEKEVEGDIPF